MKTLHCGIALAFTLHGAVLASDEQAQAFPQGGEREVPARGIDDRDR